MRDGWERKVRPSAAWPQSRPRSGQIWSLLLKNGQATAAQHRARSHRRATSGKKPPPHRIWQEAPTVQHRARSHSRAASGKKPPPHSIRQEATAALHLARSHRCAVSDSPHSSPAPTTFTFILHISPPPQSLSFNFSFQLLDWPVGSDSLNISPRAAG